MITIQDIINTLNQIEVKGKDNLDKLLSVIICLEMMANPQGEQQKEITGEGE